MEIRPIHRLPGRLRVGYDRRRYPIRQATLAQTLLLSQEGILDVTLNGVRGSMLVRYNPAALSEREVLALFLALGSKYLEDADLLESLGAVEPHRSLLAELLGQTLRHVVRSLIMPPLIGRVLTWINVAPRVVRGAGKVLSGHPFTSETLDTAALCAALLSGDTRTASSVSLLLKMGERWKTSPARPPTAIWRGRCWLPMRLPRCWMTKGRSGACLWVLCVWAIA